MKLTDLKKLAPEERLKALKELETERKKEIEEAEKLMKESETELEEETKEKERLPIPQLKSVDINSLFYSDEKEMFKTKHFVSEKPKLEETIEEARAEMPEEEMAEAEKIAQREQVFQQQYMALVQSDIQKMQQMSAKDIYNTAKNMQSEISEAYKQGAGITPEMRAERAALMYMGEKIERRLEEGAYKAAPEEVRQMLDVTAAVVKYLSVSKPDEKRTI